MPDDKPDPLLDEFRKLRVGVVYLATTLGVVGMAIAAAIVVAGRFF